MKDHYNASDWAATGPSGLTIVLWRLTGRKLTSEMTFENCGLQIYHMSYFYGIAWNFVKDAFSSNPELIDKIMAIASGKNTTILHFNNNYCKNIKIDINEPTAYSILAEQYCPNVFKLANPYF